MDDSLIGCTLGSYQIQRLIGCGGMGEVYAAWDTNLDRPVAVKVIQSRYRNATTYTGRFIREARAVSTWHHPNIVQIYYAGSEACKDGAQGKIYYFVMEYLDGSDLNTTLDQTVRQGTFLPNREVLRIGRAVADALDYAHQRGVVHRDVKPANVLFSSDGRVVLTDFGLATDARRESEGEVFGSVHYISPEQARRSSAAKSQSDLYALGVMLYEMLTGLVPFDDPSPAAVAVQHITLPPPLPKTLNPQLSDACQAVLLKALSKAPDQRYASGIELMDALAATLPIDPSATLPPIVLPPPPPGVAAVEYTPPAPVLSPDDPNELTGQQLDEYRLEALLGHGGMARVYRGTDLRLKRPVAIKVIDPSFRNQSNYATRFAREAQAIAQIDHPNIVKLYRYGEANGLYYIAMQYIEGEDLAAWLARFRNYGQLPPSDQLLALLEDVCQALDNIHAQGIIHRDLKPSNIMITRQGKAILTDFGLALVTDVGSRGEIFGSPHYISPEQAISSAKVVPQSDLYSLGVILYEIFTGQLPFESEAPFEIAIQHMSEMPRPPRALRPDLSPALEAVILKALAKQPEERFTSGQAFYTALTKALNTAAPEALPVPEVAQPGSKPLAQKASRPAWLLFASLAMLAVVAGVIWFGNNLFPARSLPAATSITTGIASPSAAAFTLTLPATQAVAALPPTSTITPSPSPTAIAASITHAPSVTPFPIVIREEDRMAMVLIPGGTFMMGGSDQDPDARFDERPPHHVTVSPYYIDLYEISVEQYAFFLKWNGRHMGATCVGSNCSVSAVEAPNRENHLLWNNWNDVDYYEPEAGFDHHPMNGVTFYGAYAYCKWAKGRLPTEAEWEFAARGSDGRLYPWGNEAPDPTRAVFAATFADLKPVNALLAGRSPFGVYGMAGSVWEWVGDYYHDYSADPLEPVPTVSNSYRADRVIRGGSWRSQPSELRVSERRRSDPIDFKNIGYDVGFRCARDVP